MSATEGRRQPGWRGLILLGVLAGAGAGALLFTDVATRDRVAESERRAALRIFHEIIAEDAYDNDLLADTIRVSDDKLLGTDSPVTVYRARRGGTPIAAVLEVVAPNGYGGPIRMLVGVRADGRVAGVRVASHNETIGLGDGIEPGKSDWITRFAGLSLEDPDPGRWLVKRDGGAFDQFTGATVTPRAVVKAVHDALVYFRANRESLLVPSAAQVTE